MLQLNVAIAGATGQFVSRAFLNRKRADQSIGRAVLLTRDASCASAKKFKSMGAEVLAVESPSVDTFKGIDVLVSCLWHGTPDEVKEAYVTSAVQAGVKLYFPTEYGTDYRIVDVNHPGWDKKQRHDDWSRQFAWKVVAVYNGHFMEDLLIPRIGYYPDKNVFEIIGETSSPFSMTSKHDVANALVEFALLATADPTVVPDRVRLAGDTKSPDEIGRVVEQQTGQRVIVASIMSAGDYKKSIDPESPDLPSHLRYISASYQLDFSKENDNELVNPSQQKWRWRTLEDTLKPEST